MNDLEQLALGTLLPAFQGTRLPDWMRRALDGGLAGTTLFGFNIADDEQLAGLTTELRQYGAPLICLDEEGGDVTRISYWTGSRYPGNAALGVVDDVDLTQAVHRAIGDDLARLGINVDLAPSADVNAVSENPVIGTRSFGSDAGLVTRHTAAAVTGLQAAGVAACVKHFPGHGATRQDSHHEVPVVDAPLDLLHARELAPFRAAIAAGTRALMTAHVRVPALTGTQPATLSSVALTDLLRGELSYSGVVITDALDMKAITEHVGLASGAVLSLAAGTDLLCLGPLPTEDDVAHIVATIVEAVRDGELPLARLEESAARVAELRTWSDATPARPAGASEVGLVAARRAVRRSGDLGGVPDPCVVEVATPPTIAVGEVPWGLAEWFDHTLRVDPGGADSPADIAARSKGRDLVVVVRDAHRNDDCRSYVRKLLDLRPDSVLVEMGLPVWRPACKAYVASYGASRVSSQAVAELLTAPSA